MRWWLIIFVLWVAPAMAIAVALLWGVLSGRGRWKAAVDPESSSAEIVELGDRSSSAAAPDDRKASKRARS